MRHFTAVAAAAAQIVIGRPTASLSSVAFSQHLCLSASGLVSATDHHNNDLDLTADYARRRRHWIKYSPAAAVAATRRC